IPVAVAVTAGDTAVFRGYVLGSADAPVEIMEFADYQCPACEKFEMVEFPYVVERLINTGRVRYVYRDFPLDQPHKWARLAAHAAACANDQGKFWEVHGGIYATQTEWSFSSRAGNQFRDIAGKQGLDLGSYDECMSSLRYAGRLQASLEEGLRLGVNSTPSFLIGGRLYPGVLPYDRIKALVDSLSPVP
ncbi:MAG: thioredoxin domain-containing protein, partial [Gemmatimonadota bacterium]